MPSWLRSLLSWLRTLLLGGPAPAAAVRSDEEPAYKPIDLAQVRRLARWLWPYRRAYLLGLILGAGTIVLEMASPLFVRGIIHYATSFATQQLAPMPTYSEAIFAILGIVAAWAAVFAAAVLLQRGMILLVTDAGERVQFDLRRALFAHLQRLSMSYFDRTRLGRIISRCTSDLYSLREINVWGISIVVNNALMLSGAALMLAVTEPRLFLSVAWLGPLIWILNHVYRRRAAVQCQIAREGFSRLSTNLAENVTGVRVVTAFHRQEWNLAAFNQLQDANTRNNVRIAWLNGVYQPTLQLIGLSGRVIILVYGGYLAASGQLSHGVGSVVAAYLYWDFFLGPILTFGNFHNQLLAAMAGAERVFDLLDTKPEVVDAPTARPLPRLSGQVRFEHVTFGYDPQRPVLHDIDFEAAPGQKVALVGHTGSGKSTIVSLIARFYVAQQGRVLLDGHDVRGATGQSLNRQIGMVQQANYLFSDSVLNNIRCADPNAARERAIQAARDLGSYDLLAALPDGFDTQVGERGGNLSLGQRQLVSFTRALLTDPRIILLDEATSSLDTTTEALVQACLERLLAGRTTFIVAHRLSTIYSADLILVLDHGRIVQRGRHEELVRAKGPYAELHRQFAIAPQLKVAAPRYVASEPRP